MAGGGGACPAAPNCWPTAHASVLVRANTPCRSVLLPVAGMLTVVQPPAAKAGLPPKMVNAPASAPAATHLCLRNVLSLGFADAPGPGPDGTRGAGTHPPCRPCVQWRTRGHPALIQKARGNVAVTG